MSRYTYGYENINCSFPEDTTDEYDDYMDQSTVPFSYNQYEPPIQSLSNPWFEQPDFEFEDSMERTGSYAENTGWMMESPNIWEDESPSHPVDFITEPYYPPDPSEPVPWYEQSNAEEMEQGWEETMAKDEELREILYQQATQIQTLETQVAQIRTLLMNQPAIVQTTSPCTEPISTEYVPPPQQINWDMALLGDEDMETCKDEIAICLEPLLRHPHTSDLKQPDADHHETETTEETPGIDWSMIPPAEQYTGNNFVTGAYPYYHPNFTAIVGCPPLLHAY